MEVAAAAPPRAREPGVAGWRAAGLLAAALVGLPLLALPLSFLSGGAAWRQVASTVLPEAVRNSLVLAAGVGVGTLVLGTALAVLVAFYDFPGRRALEWALVLPLAMPGYVLTFVLLGQYSFGSPLEGVLPLPDLRSAGGAIGVLTLVLYPYVYLLGRAAFVAQARTPVEAARALGASELGAIARVAVPLARPALAAGTALAVMEALADFGTVNLLGFRALTDAIYRVWYGAFDRQAALQLGFMLLLLVLALLAVERLTRRRARYDGVAGRGEELARRRLRGPAAALALALPLGLLALTFAGPVVQLVVWAVRSLGSGAFDGGLLAAARSSILLAAATAALAVGLATVIVYGLRVAPSRPRRAGARVAALGYAVPGSVLAVAVFVPLAWLDERLASAVEAVLGVDPGLLLTGSALALLVAYLARFMALAYGAADAQMTRIPARLDEAARGLGASRSRVLAEVHAPLLWPGLVTAALLVFVEVMKELPATVLLRPVGMDTLAVQVWEATRESLYETAALPALLIVAVGLIPVIVLVRLVDRREQGLLGP